MRVPFSRWMAIAVTAVSVTAISSTGCSTMSHVPGSSYVTGWWNKAPSESYASSSPRPSTQSEPTVTVSQGNASAGPTDIANTPYGGAGGYGSTQPSGGYPTQPAGAITPNYATGGSGANPYAEVAAQHGYQGGASTQVTPASNPYGGSPSSVYGNSSAPASPYANPYAGSAGTQTADARNSDWGNTSPAGASAYGQQPASTSSIQPYGGSQTGAQPYGNPTPPPSYTPAAPPASNYGSGGYGANSYGGTPAPAETAPMSQPSADGYAPFGTSSYAERQQPAPIDDAADLYGGSDIEPAGYQQGAPASGGYQAAPAPSGNYGGGSAYGGYQQPSSQPLY